ncbi:Phosphatidylinositol 4-phosphate 5-kinase 6 (AtPIP5K6) (1-phosphatidylinositol 4-phosphate kinase 6) (Diphosphoinositide kinase 6) (PtdIns(4)P-5-kinase 6) [Durusdinium trenchii]|uniref:Phosphatidylinositol 4-phosphate 5-kinase 6 (AtPIP5K6) (1-phosphatidylinositol 4-phosphate kinase 6) (Diphosphoinositide kinase 6) (PtdIns(4)P-5-kinase 6) n=1 Tax=Durusdinium trenchii TaxID=1381693 RepID=A0ABP0RWQ2_9DINO
MAEAERLCAELRALAKERREDWKLSFHEKASTASAASARLREEWRSWREQLLAQEVAQLPDGHRVLLQALLCEMLSSYAELLPGFSVPPTPRERDSLAARLQQLASAAQAETLRRLADRPRQETSFRSAHTSMLLRKLDISEPPSPRSSVLQIWDAWYAAAEKRFQTTARRQERRTKAVALEAAEALQGAVWTKAAVRIQAFCRGRWGRGWAYCWDQPTVPSDECPCSVGDRAREPRTAELAKEFARLRKRRKAQKAFELVRAAARLRWWVGNGWNMLEVERIRTAVEKTVAWSPALPVELMLLKAWQHEHEELLQRERFVQRATRRFEAQWTRYAEGLEAFARTQATERSKNRDHWVATADQRTGQPVWLNERTGQLRANDPTELRVKGAVSSWARPALETPSLDSTPAGRLEVTTLLVSPQDRPCTVVGQLEEHLAQLQGTWDQEHQSIAVTEDEAFAALYAANLEERGELSAAGVEMELWGRKGRHLSDLCSPFETGLKAVPTNSLFFNLPETASVFDATKLPEGPHERGPVELEHHIVYTGQWLGRRRHGEGVLLRPDGGRYEGQFVNDRACGRGRFVHANGDVYEGQWLDDKAHGSGKFLHSDGSSYIGDWVEDMKSGQGLETWADGSTFKGEYRDGKKHGHGVFTSSDNSSYSGQFVNDSMHGEGTYTFSDGRVYVGTWQDSQMTGNGTMRWPDGRWYEGGYLNDRKSGDGKFSWPDGRCYVGQWLEGKQHGTGRYIDAKGISREGLWKAGTRLRWVDEVKESPNQ